MVEKIFNETEQNFIDDLVDTVNCKNCPCQKGCEVYSNIDCFIRIVDWAKSEIE